MKKNDATGNGKPIYKKWYFWVVIVIVLAAIGGAMGSPKSESDPGETEQQQETQVADEPAGDSVDAPVEEEPASDPDVPAEYTSALNQAIAYSDTMHMSKQGIYDQLVSEYGGQFSEEAAQYAVDTVEADWNANALAKAENYSDTMYMSKKGIYDQLISEYGEQFTEAEAQYAVDNLDADYKANALEKARNYQETMNMSPEAIRDQLVSEYGEQFTQEEADYAVENL